MQESANPLPRCGALFLVRCESVASPAHSRTTPLLSCRERAVLSLLAEGYRYDQVAIRLNISMGSVRTYVTRTYRKLGVNTKSEATALALRAGILR
jgi:DNA-binding NarL/FixJ family response regulator